LTVHGDDFTATGSDQNFEWLKTEFEKMFEIKTQNLGPATWQKKEIRVLNRIIRWTEWGLEYEADQRHADMVVRDLGLENAKAVTSPGTREDHAMSSIPEVGVAAEIEDDSLLLDARRHDCTVALQPGATIWPKIASTCNTFARSAVAGWPTLGKATGPP
jgi:hypothetical protein